MPGGREHHVKIIDVSISGAAFETQAKPAIGTPVMLGSTEAHVVRVFNNVVAVEFARPFSAESDPGVLPL